MAHGGRNVTIIGNTVKDPVQSIAIIPFQAGDATERFTVSGNTLECSTGAISGYTGQNGGIMFQGDSDASIPDPTDVAITGNTIVNANRIAKHANQGGIQVGYSERVQITGNTITNAACNGIVLTDTEESVTITGNVISAVLHDATANTQNGVFVRAVSKGIIGGNTFDNLADATYGRGISFSGASKLTIGDNSFQDVTTPIRNDTRVLTLSATETALDLEGIDSVVFNQSGTATVQTFTNVETNKIYSFRFNNGNTTIDRSNAALNGGSNITGSANDVVLMIGKSATELRQVAPISVNS
jgi:parallel beta-helix repeat protein